MPYPLRYDPRTPTVIFVDGPSKEIEALLGFMGLPAHKLCPTHNGVAVDLIALGMCIQGFSPEERLTLDKHFSTSHVIDLNLTFLQRIYAQQGGTMRPQVIPPVGVPYTSKDPHEALPCIDIGGAIITAPLMAVLSLFMANPTPSKVNAMLPIN